MQEKVTGSRFACLMRVSDTAASTGLHTARAACFHLKSRTPDFPHPCCLDTFLAAHHGHLPSTPSHPTLTAAGLEIPLALPREWATCGCSVIPTTEVSHTEAALCLWDCHRPQIYHLTLDSYTAFFRHLQCLVAWIPFHSYAPSWSNWPITCCFIFGSCWLASALSNQVWSLVRVSRADTCSSVSLQLFLEVSRMLALARDSSKPHEECAGLCSKALHSPVLHWVTYFRGQVTQSWGLSSSRS